MGCTTGSPKHALDRLTQLKISYDLPYLSSQDGHTLTFASSLHQQLPQLYSFSIKATGSTLSSKQKDQIQVPPADQISQELTQCLQQHIQELNLSKVSRIIVKDPTFATFNHKQKILRCLLKALLLFDHQHKSSPIHLKQVIFDWRRQQFQQLLQYTQQFLSSLFILLD